MSIPLDAVRQLHKEPGAQQRLQKQYGGHREVDRDGSVYASVGNRPIPPPKALKSIHAQRQEEKKQREEDEEAEAFAEAHGMGVSEDRTALHFQEDTSSEAVRRKRELAQVNLDGQLWQTAYAYEIQGCGIADCNGSYEYSTASSHGAPVYQSRDGWTLHRGRPPVQETIGSGEEVTEFGWIISKGGKPMYAAKTEELLAPAAGWQCFYGPPPTPSSVVHLPWTEHFLRACGELKDAGNTALSQGGESLAREHYSKALGMLEGYEDMTSGSRDLQKLVVTLYANRAEVCLRLKLWSAAIEDAQQALARDAGHVKAAVRLAKACRAQRAWQEAIGPLKAVLAALAPQGHSEVQGYLDEAEVMAACEAGRSGLSAVYEEAKLFRQELERGQLRSAGPGAELQHAAQVLAASLRDLEDGGAAKASVQRELHFLLQGLSVLDAALAAARDEAQADWSLELLAACVGSHLREDGLKRVLQGLPKVVPSMAENPAMALELVRRLLKHPGREKLKVADAIVEVKGLLVSCLRPWLQLMDARFAEEADARVAEVVHQLSSQVSRLDNLEALALALFVECFIGKKTEQGVTGGFSLYLGGLTRQVVLDLLRRWSGDCRVLQSLSPDLVGRVWLSTATKLRRDAGLEVEKALPAGKGKVLKLEWFKLKDATALTRNAGTFFPEDLLVALLTFLKAHLKATCERGEEKEVRDGIAARHPAEEWMDEVLDKPFAWGILLPMVMAPPSLACPALALLESLIERHPHNEKLANRLAGLHLFMPLLSLPWPQAQPATSHLGRTVVSSPLGRRGVCAVLRCTIDTEIGMRVARDATTLVLRSTLALLEAVLRDRDFPESLIAITDVLGIIAGNLECWDRVPEDAIAAVFEEFLRNDHKPSRNQLAKVLRALHTDATTGPIFRELMGGERFSLGEEQRQAVLQEIFDVKTMAGKFRAERIMEAMTQEEQKPLDAVPAKEKERRRTEALGRAIYEHYLQPKESSRVLVMGRIARTFCRLLGGKPGVQIVLGDTTLEKLNKSELGENVRATLLPLPQAVDADSELADPANFDLVITGEPTGYFDASEYADRLRPFVKRRELEEERKKDQVQWLCVELPDRLEDAVDDMYSAGYYKADHDEGFEPLRKAALKLELGVALFALPSYERERRKRSEDRLALERKLRREKEEEAQAQRDEEQEQRRNVLCETLFDSLLSAVEISSLPVAYELGAEPEDAELVLFWLHGNSEPAGASQVLFESILPQCEAPVRVVAVTFPEGRSWWYRWSDEVAVNHGTEFYELSEGPYDEAIEKAKKEPFKNISFGKPTFEEMVCLEEMEPCCKQLLNLAEEELAGGLKDSCRLAFGGFSQGGGVAAYAALAGTAPAEVQARLCAVLPCCSGVPVLHFLAPKMQKTCLASREEDVLQQPLRVRMIYGTGDTEVKESYVETSRDLYKRFDYPVTLTRFDASGEDRFPEQVRREQLLRALRAWTKPL